MIQSSKNPRLKAARLLLGNRRSGRAAERVAELLAADLERCHLPAHADLLVLEGPNLVQAGIDAGLVMPTVLATQEFIDREHPVLHALDVLEVETDLLHQLTDADSPRGLISIAEAPRFPALDSFVPELTHAGETLLYLDQLQDPSNVGAIARVAEASGVRALLLSPGCAGWRHPRALRASAGSALRLPMYQNVAAETLCTALQEKSADSNLDESDNGWAWYELSAGGLSVFDTPVAERRVLAIGSESHGISAEVERLCQHQLSIPMEGEVESLNVATATAVALFEIQRRAPLLQLGVGD